MKITSWAIFFVAILMFIFVRNQIDQDTNNQNLMLQVQYNKSIDTATQDAAYALIANGSQAKESQYQSAKNVRINKEEAVSTFFRTMYMNFNVTHDTVGQEQLNGYVPALIIISYDGYYLYHYEEYKDANGNAMLKQVWSPKKPYAYRDNQNNTYNFTLDNYVTISRESDRKKYEGFREDLQSEVSIAFLNDEAKFDQVRRTTIVNAIQNDLGYTINQYNTYSKQYGISYTFTVPYISKEDWNNTINDAGVLAFVQGIPLGNTYYNNYALGGARIIKNETFQGIEVEGRKYYYSSNSCKSNYSTEEVFTTAKAAAQKGYIPLRCGIGN